MKNFHNENCILVENRTFLIEQSLGIKIHFWRSDNTSVLSKRKWKFLTTICRVLQLHKSVLTLRSTGANKQRVLKQTWQPPTVWRFCKSSAVYIITLCIKGYYTYLWLPTLLSENLCVIQGLYVLEGPEWPISSHLGATYFVQSREFSLIKDGWDKNETHSIRAANFWW